MLSLNLNIWGTLNYFLGMVIQVEDKYLLSHRKYIKELLQKT